METTKARQGDGRCVQLLRDVRTLAVALQDYGEVDKRKGSLKESTTYEQWSLGRGKQSTDVGVLTTTSASQISKGSQKEFKPRVNKNTTSALSRLTDLSLRNGVNNSAKNLQDSRGPREFRNKLTLLPVLNGTGHESMSHWDPVTLLSFLQMTSSSYRSDATKPSQWMFDEELVETKHIDGRILMMLATDPWEDGCACLCLNPGLRREITATAIAAASQAHGSSGQRCLSAMSGVVKSLKLNQKNGPLGKCLQHNVPESMYREVFCTCSQLRVCGFDSLRCIVRCNFTLEAKWQDDRLRGCPQEVLDRLHVCKTNDIANTRCCTTPWAGEDLFDPNIQVGGASDRLRWTSMEQKVSEPESGTVAWTKTFSGSFSTRISEHKTAISKAFDEESSFAIIVRLGRKNRTSMTDAARFVPELTHAQRVHDPHGNLQTDCTRIGAVTSFHEDIVNSGRTELRIITRVRLQHSWYMKSTVPYLMSLSLAALCLFSVPITESTSVRVRQENCLLLLLPLVFMKFRMKEQIRKTQDGRVVDNYFTFSFFVIVVHMPLSVAAEVHQSEATYLNDNTGWIAFVMWIVYHTYLCYKSERICWCSRSASKKIHNNESSEDSVQAAVVSPQLAARAATDGRYKEVQVGFRIINIGEVDCSRAIFFCRVQINASWRECQLAQCSLSRARRLRCHVKDDISSPQVHLPSWQQEGLFDPSFEIVNSSSDVHLTDFSLRVSDVNTGEVECTKTFRGWFNMACESDGELFSFPFDFRKLLLRVRVRPQQKWSTPIKLVSWTENSFVECGGSSEWALVGYTANALNTEFRVVAIIRRCHSWYSWNILGVISWTVCISWSAFALLEGVDKFSTAKENQVAVLLSFGILLCKAYLSKSMPQPARVSTVLDQIFGGSFVVSLTPLFYPPIMSVFGMQAHLDQYNFLTIMVCVWGILVLYIIGSLLRIFERRTRELATALPEAQADSSIQPKGTTVLLLQEPMRVSKPAPNVLQRSANGVQVKLGYKIVGIGDIDCTRSLFFCHFKLFAEWIDRKLVGCPQHLADHLFTNVTANISSVRSKVDWAKEGFFDPDLLVINGHDLKLVYFDQQVLKRDKGVIKCTREYSGWLEIRQNKGSGLRSFPFDYHELRILVRPRSMHKEQASLIVWQGKHTADSGESNEWKLVGHRADVVTRRVSGVTSGDAVFSEFHCVVMVRRYHRWYIWNVFCLMAVMVVIAMVTFVMPLDHFQARFQVSVTMMVACMMIKYGLVDQLPR